MNNPFSRLKHYLSDKIDPQENHATECLAACLVFSSTIRHAFIKFLSDKIQIDASSEIEVVTQQTIDSGGYIDLLLQQQDKFVVGIEVKVKSPENCPHHCKQLQNYRKWLDNKNESNRYLFTLVRNKDNTFSPQQYGANERHTWRGLHNYFQQMLKADTLLDVEISLIRNFCEYLESEGIVTTYDTKDLLNYAAGVKARKAINGVFNQVASQLEESGFEVRSVEDRKDAWPQLKIRHPRWEKIFGKGENWKISLWFAVPGIWERTEEDQHDFYPEIELWHIEHQNDWEYTKKKLPQWLKILESEGFNWTVYPSWNSYQSNTPANKIQSQPKRIFFGKIGVELKDKELLLRDEEALVSKLVDWVKQFAKVIDSLDVS
jgi:hypothetical protein